MSARTFSLRPFPAAGPPPALAIGGKIVRAGGTLAVRFEVRGSPWEVALPPPACPPSRRSGLWEETCFEFFVAPEAGAGYWECNVSPAGHWNVYRFTSYRRGMREDPAFVSLPCTVEGGPDLLVLAAQMDLEGIAREDEGVEVAVCAVIRSRSGELSYWALTHCGQRADFHRRDGFLLKL